MWPASTFFAIQLSNSRLRGPGELRHGWRQEAVRLLREAEKDLGNDSNFGIDVV